MPRDANGVFSLSPGYLAVTGQTILASQHNPPLEDIAEGLTNSLPRNGSAPMIAPFDMGGFRVVNVGTPTGDGDAATKAYLDAAIAALTAGLAPTGMRGSFFRITAPTGWVKANGGTIGSTASGATTRANADTENLFTLFWTSFSNLILPIQDSAGAVSTRGASAAADFTANKRLPIFDLRTRYDRGADDGLGFDATATVGAIQADGIKNHKHAGETNTDGAHNHDFPRSNDAGAAPAGYDFRSDIAKSFDTSIASSGSNHKHAFTTNDNTGGLALETRVRTVVALHCIKL